jgi:hypothetical protein
MKIKNLLGCLATYILILFRHGYVFGSGDQSEMLPYAKYLADNSLYTKDFYIQSIAAFVPNERFVFSKSLSYFTHHLPEVTLGLHCLASMGLLLGLRYLSEKWLTTELMRWIATLAPILLLYNINLGGNELYYNSLTPSYLAQAIGLWAFVLVFSGYLGWAYALIFLATFIHPLIGVQLWLLVAATHFIAKFKDAAYENWLTIIGINAGYLLTAGFYIYKIKSNYDTGNADNNLLLNIIEFRAPHHYFPSYYPLKNWLILLPLFTFYFISAHTLLRVLIGVLLTGCAVYAFGVSVLKSPTILSTQWFATTVWLKTFSIMAFIGIIESFIVDTKWAKKILYNPFILKGLGVSALLSVIFMTPQYQVFKNKDYDFSMTLLSQKPEVDIALKAQSLTPKDAQFMIPPNLSEFRFWSERSSFIDYKATNHRQAAFAEWYSRIQQVYHINLDNRRNNTDLLYLANLNYLQLGEGEFRLWAAHSGVTHIITYKNHVLNFQKIGENEVFVIYLIK